VPKPGTPGRHDGLAEADDAVTAALRSDEPGFGDYGVQAAKMLIGSLRQHGSRLAARARMPVPPAQHGR